MNKAKEIIKTVHKLQESVFSSPRRYHYIYSPEEAGNIANTMFASKRTKNGGKIISVDYEDMSSNWEFTLQTQDAKYSDYIDGFTVDIPEEIFKDKRGTQKGIQQQIQKYIQDELDYY